VPMPHSTPKPTKSAGYKANDTMNTETPNPVNHPPHYTQHPSGVECIQVTECMNFCLGNAVKYIWRADLKNDAIEDLEKAKWYVSREIERRKRQKDVIASRQNIETQPPDSTA
jgi:Protein of unknwon function (DUF3310)